MAVASPGTVAPPPAHADPGILSSIGTRQALAGFFLSGVMLSFLGAILPSWQRLSSDYFTVGLYFLGLIAGLLSAVGAAPRLLERKGLSWTLSFACAIAGTGFLYLALTSPPWDPWWRVGGMAVIGFAAGLSASTKQPDAAKALIKFLSAPSAAATLRANGVEPAT